MRIAIDCRSLRKKPAGVPNFLISFINRLAIYEPDSLIYLLCNEEFSPEVKLRLKTRPNIHSIIKPLPFFPSIAILWYFILLPILVRQLKVDFFYTPIPNLPFFIPRKIKKIITVHDMVYKLFPKTMSSGNWWINFFLHDRSILKADYIWAVSNYTKNEIEKFFPKRKSSLFIQGSSIEKQIFIKMSISEERQKEVLSMFSVDQKFILFVGTLEPRKNLFFLLSLMPELIMKGFALLIVGGKGWGKEHELLHLKDFTEYQKSRVKFSGFISNEDLVCLYNLASVYVSTSLNEGFGMPQLEAMSCGCPVVSPHNSAMIEIVEGAGETVKGWERNDWITTILKVAENREFYTSKCLERAQKYDWNLVTTNLIKQLNQTPI